MTLDDWIDGLQDCRAGNPADPKRNEAYQLGYSYEYQMEQVKSERNIQQERK